MADMGSISSKILISILSPKHYQEQLWAQSSTWETQGVEKRQMSNYKKLSTKIEMIRTYLKILAVMSYA